MSLPTLWVYKCNARAHSMQISAGDWDVFFAGPQPSEWGTSQTMASPGSLEILRNRMERGDLVLAWQTDKRAAVGLCQVDRLVDRSDGEREMILRLVDEPFSPPARLLDLRKTNRALERVRCFQAGWPRTLYETSASEARVLLRACGVDPARFATSVRTRRVVPSGGGFGTAEENAKVEAAAIRCFKRQYAGWSLDDRQRFNEGYDFIASKGKIERHIEVKGTRGPHPTFIITANEVAAAKLDPHWRLLVVTNALATKPRVTEWTAHEFLRRFETKPMSYMARVR